VLREALPQASGLARVQIINTQGDRRDAGAVPLLTPFTLDPDTLTAEAALAALGKIASKPARTALESIRTAQSGQQPAAQNALLTLADHWATENPAGAREVYTSLLGAEQPAYARRAAFAGLLRLDRDAGLKRVQETLAGADAILKPVAISAIRQLKGGGVSATFAGLLGQLEPAAQGWLIEALADRNDAAARTAIEGATTSAEAEVRFAAIKALGRIGSAVNVPALVQALGRATATEEVAATDNALATLPGGQETDIALLVQLKLATPENAPRLITLLGKRQSRSALPALLEATDSPQPAVARAAYRALGRMAQPEDLPVLLTRLTKATTPEGREEAENAIALAARKIETPDRRAEPLLAALQQATTPAVRASLVRLLPMAGGSKALAAVSAARQETNVEVQEAAVRALADWPDAAAWTSLLGIYQTPPSEAWRALAVQALVRLAGEESAQPTPALVERYRQLFGGAKNDADRKLILGGLAGINHLEALQLAIAQLDNPGTKAEASLAVKRIATALKAKEPAAAEALKKLP
jgi:HEAT repeat protein